MQATTPADNSSPAWQTLPHSGLPSTKLAWDADLLLKADNQNPGLPHPGMVVIRFGTARDRYQKLADLIPAAWPIALCIDEPTFTRKFTQLIQERLLWLGRKSASLVIVNVHEPADLKAGGIPHQAQVLRENHTIQALGLFHRDIMQAEWMASHTNGRVLAFPYTIENQLARYRVTEKAAEYGMDCLGLATPLADEPIEASDSSLSDETGICAEPWPEADGLDLAFQLGDAARVLPTIGQSIADVQPLGPEAVEAAWEKYRSHVPEPAKLPRSLPPD